MNKPVWQASVTDIVREFADAGPFVVQLNAHRWFQLSAISPQKHEAVIVERAKMGENAGTRSRMVDSMEAYLTRIGVDTEKVDFVMDVKSKVALHTIGTKKHPIYSTGSKNLKKRLLQSYEMMDVVDKNWMPKFTAGAYKVMRDRCRVIESAKFNERCDCLTMHLNNELSPCDLRGIGNDLTKVFSDTVMQELYPDQELRDGMRELYQNALNAIQVVAALDSNSKNDVVKYLDIFKKLVNPDENQVQFHHCKGSCPNFRDISTTVDRLLSLAKSEASFSLPYFNLILDYYISDIEFDVTTLTTAIALPKKIHYRQFEPVTFDVPLTLRPVLSRNDKDTIAEAIKLSAMDA